MADAAVGRLHLTLPLLTRALQAGDSGGFHEEVVARLARALGMALAAHAGGATSSSSSVLKAAMAGLALPNGSGADSSDYDDSGGGAGYGLLTAQQRADVALLL